MKTILKLNLIILLCVISFSNIYAKKKWARKSAPIEQPLRLFNSIEAVNLKTAESIPKGDLYYSIAHRFRAPVSGGFDNFLGMDGGSMMSTRIGYGVLDNLMLTIGRTSKDKQYDMELKYKFFNLKSDVFPLMISVNAGYAYSSANFQEDKDINIGIDVNQYNVSLIFNTMFKELFGSDMAIGFGLTPTYLQNSLVGQFENKSSITLGYYTQFYFGNDMTSIILESNPTVSGWRSQLDGRKGYDTYALGLELETGGHFFKIMLSNNVLINTSQFQAGSLEVFAWKNLLLGFQITRNF